MRNTRLGRALGMTSPEPDQTVSTTLTPAAALLRSGLFDVDFYAACAGEVFPDRRTAARHCLNIGMPTGLSPSPFLSRSHLNRKVRQAWSRGQIVKLLDELAKPEAWVGPFGPLFDPRVYLESLGGADADLSGLNPLGHFLSNAADDTPMPVPRGYAPLPPTYAEARGALLGRARELTVQGRDISSGELALHAAAAAPWRKGTLSSSGMFPGGPLVSIVAPLPATETGVFALEAIAQMQVLQRWELLLVGTPKTGLAPFDGRTRIVPLPEVDALSDDPEAETPDWRNVGLEAAEGAFVAFLPPGHHWRPEFLRAAVQRLTETGLECGQAGVSLHDPSGRATVASAPGDLATLRAGGWVDLGALVCRADAARDCGGFTSLLGTGTEPEFAIRMASRATIDPMPFVASDRMVNTLPAGSTTAAGADGDWLAVLGAAWVDWADVRRRVTERRAGRVSVVIPTYDDSKMTVVAARTLLDATSITDIEVTIVDNGSPLETGLELIASFVGDDRVRYVRLPVNLHFAIACNVGFAASTGNRVVFLNNDTRSDCDWLPSLLVHLDDESVAGAQPVLVYDDDTIQTAGTIFPLTDGLACHFLVSQPVAAARATAGMRFEAATAAALALRAADVASLEGFDAHFINGMEDVDLCLRLLESRPGGFRVEPDSMVVHYEGKTPGRGNRIPQNRQFFMDRWAGRLPGPETDKFEAAGYDVTAVETDGLDIPSPRPIIVKQA